MPFFHYPFFYNPNYYNRFKNYNRRPISNTSYVSQTSQKEADADCIFRRCPANAMPLNDFRIC